MTDDYRNDDGLFIARRCLEEEFSIGETYATRQEAIDGYAEEYGEPDGAHFQTAKLRYVRELPPSPLCVDRLIEDALENASSEWWESAVENLENAIVGHEAELEKKLEGVWETWCEKHNLYLEGYRADDVESHTVGEDESESELARRKAERLASWNATADRLAAEKPHPLGEDSDG